MISSSAAASSFWQWLFLLALLGSRLVHLIIIWDQNTLYSSMANSSDYVVIGSELKPDPNSLPLPGEKHENSWYNQDFNFKVSEHVLYEKRHVRIVLVGAGAVGLQFAYKAPQALNNFEYTIYEKNHDLGGTCETLQRPFSTIVCAKLASLGLENRYRE
jgi:hypothetical protein